uniref:Reverse transcriptase domain-containing protein n=1 Tax=Fagus sylvatica TaxID=28930 RepID=A0A2N9HCL8_FAGSY
MDEITGRWQDLALTEKEGSLIVLTPEEEDEGSILAAWFLTPRMINMESVLRALKPLWRPGSGFKARDMGNNKAMFVFQNDADAERVLINGPRSFDKHLIILSRLDDTVPFSKACFDFMFFWVQIHDLPVKMMKPAACARIGSTLGVLEQVEDVGEGQSKGSFMRVRVTIDIRQPLCRGRKVGLGGTGECWVSFKYERLTNFCYWCGRITHGEKDCEIWLRSRGSLLNAQQPYGAWMKGETERMGRHPVRTVDKMGERGGGVAGGTQGRVPAHREEMQHTSLKGKSANSRVSGTNISRNVETDTMPQSQESNLGLQREECMANRRKVSEGVSMATGNEGPIAVTPTVNEGLGNPKAVRALHSMVKMKGPKVLFLLETKLDGARMEVVRVKLGFDNVFSVPSLGRSGGLALLWKNEAEVVIQNFSQHHIDAHVDSQQEKCWRLTGFYGRPEQHRRKESWALLKHLSTIDSAPWLCIGDFNELLASHEKIGGNARSLRQILEFQDAVNVGHLVDLGYRGANYTWNNNRDDKENIQGRLDRALATSAWMDWFPNYNVTHCPGSVSDHLALVVITKAKPAVQRRQKWVKRFEEKWATHPACEEIIRSSWNQQAAVGSPMFQLCHKLSWCRKALVDWSRGIFGAINLQIDHKMAALEALHEDNHGGKHNLQIRALQDEVNLLLHQDELHWRQRSREIWLKAGDRNTKYFHQKAKQRRGKNIIRGMLDSNGQWCEDEQGMGAIAVQYFNDIFSSSAGLEVEDTVRVLDRVITSDMNCQLLAPFTAVEIQQAAFQMHPSKSPGPDGYMLRKANHSHIVLIPKKQNSQSIADYRPISLSNVVYKILSKVLANRLKSILPSIISESQSAFVPGRQITDNVAVAFELMHALRSRRKGKLSQMAIKLDMSKAYDRVEWIFLERVMQQMGFARRWIHLMMTCVRTTSYSVLLNGETRGYIKPSRGIRQGDPLSPYLFLLCAEGLSALLRQAGRERRINGVSICRGGPKISHLLFADDSLLFYDASTEECSRLMEVLQTYERASGQVVNRDKTALFFSKNTPDYKRDSIQQLWGVRGSSNFERYLGLPAMVGKSKQQTFNGLKEALARRLQGWKERSLSKAGRAILIKTIAQAIPTYTMSCFKLPKVWCDSVNSLVSKYWWGQSKEENKIHWINWGRLCTPKDEGGMGFRDLNCFNLALLAKQGWAKLGSNPSFMWRSILAARELLLKGIRWKLGNGKAVHIWNDDWGVSDLHPQAQAREVQWVAELIDSSSGVWDMDVLQEVFDPATAVQIQQVPLANPTGNDSISWKATRSSSTMKQYHKFWKVLWKIKVPNKIKIHLWRACMNALPTGLALHRRRVINDPLCPVCGVEVETPTHALWTCSYAGSVWAFAPGRLSKMPAMHVDFFLLSSQILHSISHEVVELWAVTAWAIWYARNKFVHEKCLPMPQATIDMAMRLLNDFKRVTIA